MNKDYWANLGKKDIADAIKERFDEYREWCERTGYFGRIKRSYDSFYAIGENGSLDLEKDERKVNIKVNHFKSLIKRLVMLVTQQRLKFDSRSINSDSESQIDSDLAEGLLEYYNAECNMNATFVEAVKTALICLESWTWCPWDSKKGREVTADLDTKELIYEGDQDFDVLTALSVARNTEMVISPWKIIKVQKHKYELAAEYPKHKDEILSDSTDSHETRYDWYLDPTQTTGRGYTSKETKDSETVDVFILYHEKGFAVPDGREVWVCGNAVLKDTPLEYKEVPLYQLKAGDVIESVWADSPSIDLLALQRGVDLLTSAVLTNNINNAQQNIWSPDPSLVVRELNESQKLITSAVKPEGINFTESSPETYKLIESMVSQQQVLSGINEAARGAGASSASGTSVAIQMGIAMQSVSDIQSNYHDLASSVGSCVINNIKTFSTTERVAYISGIKKKSSAKRFTADDLENIDRIIVSIGNPMTDSMAGRWELMMNFVEHGVITDPSVLAAFLETGEIESATEDTFADSMLIRDENQLMLKGGLPTVIMTDDHPRHIQEHKSIFSDSETRSNPALIQNALDHIMDHIQAMKQIDPDLAAILGMQPLPSQMMMTAPAGPGQPIGNTGPDVNLPAETPPEMVDTTQQAINNLPGTGN